MKVITAINKYLKTEKEIFLQCDTDGTVIRPIDKSKDFYLEFGEIIANTKVKCINELESPGSVTIFI